MVGDQKHRSARQVLESEALGPEVPAVDRARDQKEPGRRVDAEAIPFRRQTLERSGAQQPGANFRAQRAQTALTTWWLELRSRLMCRLVRDRDGRTQVPCRIRVHPRPFTPRSGSWATPLAGGAL